MLFQVGQQPLPNMLANHSLRLTVGGKAFAETRTICLYLSNGPDGPRPWL